MKNVSEMTVKTDRPVKIVQFGEGNFLRAFVDWIIDILNEKSDFNGSVMMVQPLKNGMGEMINAQNGIYTTVLRGVQNGKPVEEFRKVTSVKGCINPFTQYDEYIKLAENPDLRFLISNTTEAGISYHEGDKLEDRPQVSYPGKVCAFLYHRYRTFGGDKSKGIIAIPCELIDKNGDNLKRIVLQYAEEWKLEEGFIVTDEPGIYFIPDLIDDWKSKGLHKDFINYDVLETYKDFGGIRIEDDLLITADGCRFLGEERIPYHPTDVENYMTNN